MQPTDKFRSDLDAALRRAGGGPAASRPEALAAFFRDYFRSLPEELLASLLSGFRERWARGEEKALAWLAATGSILLMDYDKTPLGREDWAEIRDAFSFDAGEIDLGLLEYAMSLVVENGAI